MENRNWIVRYYDENDDLISSHSITDRTEQEAENEAIADMPSNCEDWSLSPEEDIVLNFDDKIMLPKGLFQDAPSEELIKVIIGRDHRFPTDENDSQYGLSDRTYKVTLYPVVPAYDGQKCRTYWSDIRSMIQKYNKNISFKKTY